MFAKLMSISDELMWRYYLLLTDLLPAEIESEKAAGRSDGLEDGAARGGSSRTSTAAAQQRRPRPSGAACTSRGRPRATWHGAPWPPAATRPATSWPAHGLAASKSEAERLPRASAR